MAPRVSEEFLNWLSGTHFLPFKAPQKMGMTLFVVRCHG